MIAHHIITARCLLAICFLGLIALAGSERQPAGRAAGPRYSDQEMQVLRDAAMSYAYYLRSSYLRHRVTHGIETGARVSNSDSRILEAVAYLERAIEYLPRATSLWWEYAALNSGLGRSSKVIDAYEQLAVLDPSAGLFGRLGMLYEMRDQPDQAVRSYRNALELKPEEDVLRERIADVYIDAGVKSREKGDDELATEQFRRAGEELAGLVDRRATVRLYDKQGIVNELIGDEDAALACFDKAMAMAPDDPDAAVHAAQIYFGRGEAAARTGDTNTAQRFYEQAVSLTRTIVPRKAPKPELLNFTAYALALTGTHLDTAEEMVTQALRKDEANGAYLDTLGWILYRQGRYEQACTHVLRALELEGEDPVITDHLGDIYLKLGQPDKAREMWERSLKLDAGNKTVRDKLGTAP